MEKLKGSIYISPKDIQIINDCSLRYAQREHQTIRDNLGIKNGRLTVKAYCEYWGISYDLVIFHINEFR